MRLILPLVAAFAATACVSVRDNHGYIPERGTDGLSALPGIDTKDSVVARYGEPTIRPPLTDDVWYYVSTQTNERAFYRPQTLERQVVAIQFDQGGTVRDVSRYGLEDGGDVNVVDRRTPTRGKELSILEQMVGGVGQAAGAVDPDN